jgi:lysophospholipase L1-like esterase
VLPHFSDTFTKRTRAILTLLIVVATMGFAAGPAPRIHLVGDSTMADKPRDKANPETGWGMPFRRFFRDSSIIVNHAVNGRSTTSFIAEGKWKAVVAELHRGDFVIIQFGHNDAKIEDSLRYAAPRGAYQDNLRRMIRASRSVGAIPMLATSVARRRWNEPGEFYDAHGDYPPAMRDVAAELNVPLLEMHKLTMEMVRGHGVEGSKMMYLHIPPGSDPKYAWKPDGWNDDTHFSEYGAQRVAELAVQEILRLQLPIEAYFRP